MRKKIWLPFCLVMLVPFVVFGKLYDTGLGNFPWFSNNTKAFDILLYYKKNAVILTAGLIMLLLVYRAFKKEIVWKELRAFVPLALYVLLAFLSSVVSPYRSFAFHGMMEQFESIWVIAGYFLICVYVYLEYCELFLTAIGVFGVIIGVIGTCQLFGFDIYRTQMAKWLCMPGNLRGIDLQVTVEIGRAYCSLSNPNYVGMLCCLTLPLLVVLAFYEQRRTKRLLYGTAVVLLLCSLIGSRSKSGIMVLAVCMLFLTGIFGGQILSALRTSPRRSAAAAVAVALIIGLVGALLAYKWNYFSESIHSMLEGQNSAETRITEISTNDDDVKIVYRSKELYISVNYEQSTLEDALLITDENGAAYLTEEKAGVLYFQDEKLAKLSAALVQYGDYIAVELYDGSFYWYFTDRTGDNTWYYLTAYGKPDKLISDEIAVFKWFEGKERLMNGRGYIWSRTIPLLKKYILLGSGQDSFAAVYANNDYLGKAQWGYKNMIITKPHCMYMQIALQSGLLSLVMLFIFWAVYFRKAFSRKTYDCQAALSKAIAVGILGYLLTGITNDSNVGVAPIFWAFLGMGLRLNTYGKYE